MSAHKTNVTSPPCEVHNITKGMTILNLLPELIDGFGGGGEQGCSSEQLLVIPDQPAEQDNYSSLGFYLTDIPLRAHSSLTESLLAAYSCTLE